MKKIISFTLLTILVLSVSHANSSFLKLEKGLENVTSNLEELLPENSTMLSVQPDAFIGRFFPSIPSRFTAGISAGATLIDTETISENFSLISKDIIDALPEDFKTSIKISFPKHIFLPNAAASLRIGGFIFPFDIGLYGITTTQGLVKDISFEDYSLSASYTCVGTDLRYAILEGGNLLPKISAGLGYIYSNFSAGFNIDKTLYNEEYGSGKLEGEMNINLTGHTVYAQVQASKKFLIFTPYAGLKAFGTVYNSDTDWKITTSGLYANLYEKGGKSSSNDFDRILCQFYTGCGIQLTFLQIALNGAYNFTNQRLSAGIGINAKI